MHSLRHFRCISEVHRQGEDVVKGVIALTTLERCGGVLRDQRELSGRPRDADRGGKTHDHLIDENSECPPVNG